MYKHSDGNTRSLIQSECQQSSNYNSKFYFLLQGKFSRDKCEVHHSLKNFDLYTGEVHCRSNVVHVNIPKQHNQVCSTFFNPRK